MNAATFLEQFGHLAEAPTGIAKLRELILQLAVRGKLVPQDPKDEPASELLAKIDAANAKLGRGRMTHSQEARGESNSGHGTVPKGWECSSLGRFVVFNYGKGIPRDRRREGGVPVYGANGILRYHHDALVKKPCIIVGRKGSAGAVNRAYAPCWPSDVTYYVVPPDGIDFEYCYLILKSSHLEGIAKGIKPGLNRNEAYAIPTLLPPLAEQKRIVARVDELMALCDDLGAEQQAKRAKQIALNRASLHALTEPKGTGLAAAWHRVRDHFDHLYTVPGTVAELRQTILQLAVMGRLVPQDPNDLPAPRPGKHFVYALECEDGSICIGQTQDVLERWKQHAAGQGADWTKKHPPVKLIHWEEYDSLEEAVQREKKLKTGFGRKWLKREIAAGRSRQAGEPASVLLERIQSEKQRLIAEGVIRKPKPLPEVGPDELPFDAPQGWGSVHLGTLAVLINGDRGKNYPSKDVLAAAGVPFINAGHLVDGLVSSSDLNYITEERFGLLRSGKIKDGDILYCIRGSLGKAAIVSGLERGAIASSLVIIRPFGGIDPTYLLTYLDSPLGKEMIRRYDNGSAQPNLAAGSVKHFAVLLPPLAEQKRIVAKVDQLMTLCDDLEAKLQQTQTDADNFLTAIVHGLVESGQGAVKG